MIKPFKRTCFLTSLIYGHHQNKQLMLSKLKALGMDAAFVHYREGKLKTFENVVLK